MMKPEIRNQNTGCVCVCECDVRVEIVKERETERERERKKWSRCIIKFDKVLKQYTKIFLLF